MTGREFREIRLRLGLAQEALAQRFEVVRMTIFRWERSRRVPRIAELALKQILAEESTAAPKKRSRG